MEAPNQGGMVCKGEKKKLRVWALTPLLSTDLFDWEVWAVREEDMYKPKKVRSLQLYIIM